MKNIYRILSLAAFALLGVACETDDTQTNALPVDPDFTVTSEDGTAFVNADDAMNVIETGTELTFTDKTDGDPQSVKWALTCEGVTKEIIAEDGKGSCTMILAGKYDVIMYADGEQLKYINYLSVEGAGTPVAEEVVLDCDFSYNGSVVTYDPVAPYTAMSGESITMQDKSGGNPSTMKWTFTCAEAGVSDVVLVEDIPYGDHAPAQTYTFKTGGMYTITQESGGKKATFANFFSLTENMFYTNGYDPGFEGGDAFGSFVNLWWWDASQCAITNTTAMSHSGNNSVCFDVITGGAVATAYKDAAGNNLEIPVVNGTSYTIGFWALVESIGSVATQVDFNFANHSPSYGGAAAVIFDPTTTLNEWKYYTVQGTAVSNNPVSLIQVRLINLQEGQTAPFKIYIDDLTMTANIVEEPEPEEKALSFTATDADGVVLTNESEALNEVGTGRVVTFKNTSTGDPANIKWTVTSVPPSMTFELTPSEGGTSEFVFAYEGVYSITMSADDVDAVTYTNYINVVDSDYVPNPDPVIPDGDILSTVGYDYSFEDVPATGDWLPLWGVYSMHTHENSVAQAHSGSKSTKFSLPANGTMATAFRGADGSQLSIDLEDGAMYEFGFWIYVETVGAGTAQIDFNFDGNNAPFGESAFLIVDANVITPKTWTYCTVQLPATSAAPAKEIIMRGSNALNADSEFVFYFDDFSMIKVVE